MSNGLAKIRAAGIAALLLVLGCAAPRPTVAAPSPGTPAPGLARIWIYRNYEPFESLARPYIRLNGAVAGISEPGGAFYRDVPPGQYRVTVDSDGRDADQFATVALVPGQTAYVKIQSSQSWDSGGGGMGGGWARPTFYTRVVPPDLAQAEIVHTPLYGGG